MKLRRLEAALYVVPTLLVLVVAPSVARENDPTDVPNAILMIETTDWFADGSSKVSRQTIDAGPDGVFPKIGNSQNQTKAAPTTAIRNTIHWERKSKIKWRITKLIKQMKYQKKMAAVVKKYCNKRRGDSGAPKQTVTKKTTNIKPIESFANPNDFYNQKVFNGKSEAIMTADDQFFKDLNGILFDPEVVIRTLVFTFGTFSQQGNRFVGTLWIVEADIFIRSDFFGLEKFVYQVLLTSSFRTATGYIGTLWTNDIQGIFKPYVDQPAFKNAKSDTWDVMKQRDKDYYNKDLIEAQNGGFSPFMRPAKHTLLDVGGRVLPAPDPFRVEELNPILFYTNLTAPDKTMTIEFKRVEVTPTGEKLRPVTTMKGEMEDWPINASFGKAYPTVFHNTVTVRDNNKGRLRLEDLREAIARFGMPMTVDGKAWNQVLECQVEIKGQDTQDGFKGQKTVKERYYFINSDNEDTGTAN